ncbi:cytochrome c oxidase subunit IVB [Bacillus canaveralius]|uniref:Cytochrome c oxidase subunit IVB n=1 Tax=Bacillus canaveralius TaxID=1403243 RepID=A0A2N5GNN2_9BACI|nr:MULTISPECIES: cytochrome c oxidase subunit IVB [Bacillus]PLR84080.1 cytochrome c oxidase subunit IVB [Bacillus canaveralius]PLR87312.1 cytochrome c oxidase subunit IVB [Bacillus sp. V33-4]PLR96274.1 cytochrome c oxidase subunit IVB [Bacillus canaveralius]RSK53540.1 cytochrome c oxidase subunit IVB [Bacillus canaveralius]
MATQQPNSGNPSVDIEYRRKKSAEEMRYQVITFSLMIFLTLVAFAAVAYDGFTGWFTIPFILLLAVVQVIFQLYYFMHMSHKGHEAPSLFLFSGVFVAAITVITFMTVIWW